MKAVNPKAIAYRLLCFPVVFLLTQNLAIGQISDSIKNELQMLSLKLYHEENSVFAILDAVIDNQIMLGAPYVFCYEDSVVTIDGKKLPPELQKTYLAKLRYLDYIRSVRTGETNVRSHSFHTFGKGLTLDDIFNENAFIRKVRLPLQTESPGHFRQLLPEFVESKLVDTTRPWSIRYNILGLFVNEIRVSDIDAVKYIRLINNEGFLAGTKDDMLYIDKEQTLCNRHAD